MTDQSRGWPRTGTWTATLLTASLLGFVLSFGCSLPSKSESPPHIFFLLLDTLRADHLSLYGYERETSPVLDHFAESAVVFDNVQSQAPCTFPSANSMLTGRYPGYFLLQPDRRIGIPADITSLPTVLQRNGYETVAVSGSPIVRRTPSKHNPTGEFDAGFSEFDEECLWNRADCINDKFFGSLDRWLSSGKPLFVYLHYMDAHDPYVLPEDHDFLFASSYEGDIPAVAAGRPGLIKRDRVLGEEMVLAEGDLRHLIDLYDERIRYMDGKLGELFNGLDARGLLDDSIIVLAADHGEQFEEHGEVAHCNALYQEELATPLIFRFPAGVSGRREKLVQNVDIVPTLLDYAGLGYDDLELDGRSLGALIDGADADRAEPFGFSAWAQSFSVRGERFKLISNLKTKRSDLFDLLENPGEAVGQEVNDLEARERLMRELADWLATRSGLPPERAEHAGEIAVEQLRALGYIP